MKAIALAALALTVAGFASAEERHGGHGFVGRSGGVSHVGSGGAFKTGGGHASPSRVSAGSVGAAPVAHVAPVAAHAAPTGRGYSSTGFSGGSRVASRASFGAGHRFASVARWAFTQGRMRRLDGDGGGTGDGTTPAPAPTRQPGEFGTVDGALLRSEGLGFKYEQPSSGERQFAVEAGDHIQADENRVLAFGGRGVFTGRRDTPPGGGAASGGNAITANRIGDD